jgi:hypothetical protein
MDSLDHIRHTDCWLLGVTTINSSSNYSITDKLPSTLEDSKIECPALRNNIPCMVYGIQLALGTLMSSVGVKGRNKSWEALDSDQQFGEYESVGIGKSQDFEKRAMLESTRCQP